MKKLILIAIASLGVACTQDKFEQIDANFAYLEARNDAQDEYLAELEVQVNLNKASILELETNLDTAVDNLIALEDRTSTTEGDIIRIDYALDALESFKDTTSDHLDVIDNLIAQLQRADEDTANNIQTALDNAQAQLALDQDNYIIYLNTLLQGATDDLKALFEETITSLEFDNSYTVAIDQSTTEVVSGTTTVETITATPTVVTNTVTGTNGVDGIDGIDGIDGAQGESVYDIYVRVTTDDPVLTEAEWIDSLRGEDGVDGEDGQDGADGTNGTNGLDGTNGTNGIDGNDAVVNAELTAQIQSLTASLTAIETTALSADSQITAFLAQLDAVQNQLDALEGVAAVETQIVDLQGQIDDLTIDTDGDGVFDILDECVTSTREAIDAALGNGTISSVGCYVAPLGSTELRLIAAAGSNLLRVEATDNFEEGDTIIINNSAEFVITSVSVGARQIGIDGFLAIDRQIGAAVIEIQN